MTDPLQLETALSAKLQRRAVSAAALGSWLEAYDWLVYGLVAGTAFPVIFFPSSTPYQSALDAFSVFFVGFIARPVGGILFGLIGDRLGRKPTLMATMLIAGVATVAIGFIPSHATIGAASAFILVAARFAQGIAFGGEWAGANALAMESGALDKRGFMTSFVQGTAMFGLFAATIGVFILQLVLSEAGFIHWGWRILFILSAILVATALWLRLRVAESPEFSDIVRKGETVSNPLYHLLKKQPLALILCIFTKSAEMIPVYVFSVFVVSYATGTLPYSYTLITLSLAGMALASVFTSLLVGRVSDKFGHERIFRIGAGVMVPFSFIYFLALKEGSPGIASLLIVLSLVPYGAMYGVEGAIFGKTFNARWRYLGSSASFNLAGIIGGGPAPFVATWLVGTFGNTYMLSVYLSVAAVVGIIAVSWVRRLNLRAWVREAASK